MKNIIKSVKGTRDFYPEEMSIRTWLYGKVRHASEAYGYQEYEAPLLETIDLYAAKSGEELVKEQSFVFPDRGGELITLRPELTPSLTRMVAQRQHQLIFPLRWWSFGPFWRYERPQKGRAREFFQWNIDLIGVANPEADAELVAIITTFFSLVGLTPDQVIILVNDRRLIDGELERIGITADKRPDVFRLIDRRSKMQPLEWETYAIDLGLNARQFQDLKSILDNADLWKKSPELKMFFEALEALNARQFVRFDANIVRGLDYYTGIVFEAQDLIGEVRRAILGGGRYDNLLADVGGNPLPGVGFAMGDVVISLILEKTGLLPKETGKASAPILATVFDQEHQIHTLRLAAELREKGLKIATYPQPDRLSKQFKYADRMGYKFAVILGPDEINAGKVTLKYLQTGEQTEIDLDNSAILIQ
ncbi:MAG: histidine--tRNA ligase, partial [Anaerolineales bacterium]